MPQATPTYFEQQQLDGQWAVYSAGGVLEIADIETRGDALNHILDLIERDRLEAAVTACVESFTALLAEAA